MNVKEIRDKKDEDLKKTLEEFKSELFDLRFQKATGSVDNPMRIRELRRSIARIYTVLKERVRQRRRGKNLQQSCYYRCF